LTSPGGSARLLYLDLLRAGLIDCPSPPTPPVAGAAVTKQRGTFLHQWVKLCRRMIVAFATGGVVLFLNLVVASGSGGEHPSGAMDAAGVRGRNFWGVWCDLLRSHWRHADAAGPVSPQYDPFSQGEGAAIRGRAEAAPIGSANL
jgi:hypothetical protein